MPRIVFAVIALLLAVGSAIAQTLSEQVRQFVKVDAPVIALTHVRVIDGTGAAAREDQTVVLSKGKIASVGSAASTNIPSDAQVLDLHGYSVIPGLVGMHDHLLYPLSYPFGAPREANLAEMPISFPRLYLAGGVTTIRTTGALEPYTELEIRNAIEAGEMSGPKIHVTGPFLQGKGSPFIQMHQLTGPEDATKTVNFWVDQGVDNFKAYANITHDELAAAIAAAHKRGVKITGHLCSIGFREAAALGIDNLEHGLIVDTEFFPWKKPGECVPLTPQAMDFFVKIEVQSGPVHDMIFDLVQRHVAVTSTLTVLEMILPGRPTIQQRVLDALSPDARSDLFASKVRLSDQATIRRLYGTDVSPWPAAFKKEMEFEYAFSKAGGLLLAGPDPSLAGVLAGFGDQREVELLVEAGFTPLEGIHIATANGAQFLGEGHRVGTIAVGKQADIVVIKGDPSTKIEDIENVEIVFKDGIGYDSAKLIDSVRGMVGSR